MSLADNEISNQQLRQGVRSMHARLMGQLGMSVEERTHIGADRHCDGYRIENEKEYVPKSTGTLANRTVLVTLQ